MTRIKESQLVLPALYLMSKSDSGFISTSDLITELTEIMRPTGIDAEILSGRSDTYFSQKVRNLKSHDTFQRNNFAINYIDGFKITPLGKAYVLDNKEILSYLFEEDFNYEDIKTAIDDIGTTNDRKVFPVEEIVLEGNIITKNVKTRARSSLLRKIAIEHFTHNNMIYCDCCGFNFPSFYGEVYGKDCIEIHHIKPIYQYQEESFKQLVDRALQNLLPVCPNCHRVIHKNHIGSESIISFINDMRKIKSL